MEKLKKMNKKATTILIIIGILLPLFLINGIPLSNIEDNQAITNTQEQDDFINNEESIEETKKLMTNTIGTDAWWNNSFNYRRLINITCDHDTTGDLENYTVSIKFNHTKLVEQGKMNSSLKDVRIIEYSKNDIPRQRYFYFDTDYPDDGDMATIWFETNITSDLEQDTYLYYGNNTVDYPNMYYKPERTPNHWWRFEEGTGTSTTADSINSAYDGTLVDIEENDWEEGLIEDYCLDLDGSTEIEYVSTPDPNLPATGFFSISLWAKADALTTGTIFDMSRGQIYLWIGYVSGSARWFYEDAADRDIQISYALSEPNAWHHIVGVGTFSSDGDEMFVDGESAGVDSRVSNGGKPVLNPPYIGNDVTSYGGTNQPFDGKVDDLRIYNRKLISTDMEWLYTPHSVKTAVNEEQAKRARVTVTVVDIHDNPVNHVNVSIFNNTYSKIEAIKWDWSDANGQVTFENLSLGSYNFTVFTYSNYPNTDVTEVINRTKKSILLNEIESSLTLKCNLTGNTFKIKDTDDLALDSGWIIIGNETHQLLNESIDTGGNSGFWWVDKTPYDGVYNFSVFYRDNDYNPKLIRLIHNQSITTKNSLIQVTVNMTTINFTVKTRTTQESIEGLIIEVRNKNTGVSIVNLSTDEDGLVSYRWFNSSGVDLNSNVTLRMKFFGAYKNFNFTTLRADFSQDALSLNITEKASYNIYVQISLDDYQTEIVSLNPRDTFQVKWGTDVKIRVMFNVTKAGGSSQLIGPAEADLISARILSGTTLVKQVSVVKDLDYEGRYIASFETNDLDDDSYFLKVSASKNGYTKPSDLTLSFTITENILQLNQSDNDDTKQTTFWDENKNMTLKAYGGYTESKYVKESLFREIENYQSSTFQISVPDINNQWNLSHVVFNFYDISYTESLPNAYFNITDPSGFKSNITQSNLYGSQQDVDKWTGININYNQKSPTGDNQFKFYIEGSFSGTIDITATAYFVRNSIEMNYSKFNQTESISISNQKSTGIGEGWAIKNVTFELYNIRDRSNWNLIDLTGKELNIITNEGINQTVQPNGNGKGLLTIDDVIIFPKNRKFTFSIQNKTGSNIMFDVDIKVNYIQEFYTNDYTEEISLNLNSPGFSAGWLTINAENADYEGWNYQESMLYISDIANSTDTLYASDVNMQISINGGAYQDVSGTIEGEAFFSLNTLNLGTIYTIAIRTSKDVNFTLSFDASYERTVLYETTGTVTYFIREEPDIKGTVNYATNLGYYSQLINTTLLDADEYTVRFTINKDHYEEAIKDLDILIQNRRTLINGTSRLFTVVKKVYVMERHNFTFKYYDVLDDIPVVDLNVKTYELTKYDSTGKSLQNASGVLTRTASDLYNLDVHTELLTIGTYKIVITLDKDNYDYKTAIIDLEILIRPTSLIASLNGTDDTLTTTSTTVDIYFGDQILFLFNYKSGLTGGILNSNMENSFYNWTKIGTNESKIEQLSVTSAGLFQLDFDTETRDIGKYTLIVYIKSKNHTQQSYTINLEIKVRRVNFTLSGFSESGEIILEQGILFTIRLTLTDDSRGGAALLGANVSLTIGSLIIELLDDDNDGVYVGSIDTATFNTFLAPEARIGKIIVEKKGYQTEEITIQIQVKMIDTPFLPGVPLFYLVLGIILIGSIVGSLVTYRYLQYARIPNFIKKANNMSKAIRGEKAIAEADLYPSKKEFIVKKLGDKWEILGLSLADILGIEITKGKKLPDQEKTVEEKRTIKKEKVKLKKEKTPKEKKQKEPKVKKEKAPKEKKLEKEIKEDTEKPQGGADE